MNNNNVQVIVFDLHEVLVVRDYKATIKSVASLVYQHINILWCLCMPSSIKLFFKLYTSSRVPEEYILAFIHKHPRLAPLFNSCISILNLQKPITLSIELVKELKHEGYTLCLFSNIGELTFYDFQQKYPHIVNLFDHVVFASQQDQWLQKPYNKAYIKFTRQTNYLPDTCLFIDNSHKNIKAAASQGFKTIHFTSAQELKKQLENNSYISSTFKFLHKAFR